MADSAFDPNDDIAKFVDHWCEQRAIGLLKIILPVWPPPNGFTDEWHAVWAALRTIRAAHRHALQELGDFDRMNECIAKMSAALFPQRNESDLDALAERLISSVFTDPSTRE